MNTNSNLIIIPEVNENKDNNNLNDNNLNSFRKNSRRSYNLKVKSTKNKISNFFYRRKPRSNLYKNKTNLMNKSKSIKPKSTRINIYKLNTLEVFRNESFYFESILFEREVICPNIITEKIRHLSFPTNLKKFSCFQISITKPREIKKVKASLRTDIKILTNLVAYVIIWFFMIACIQSVYENYRNTMLDVVVFPFISTFFVKIFITSTIMSLISTIIIYKYGPYYYSRKKYSLFKLIILKILVDPNAYKRYSAIRTYKTILREFPKLKSLH